MDIFNFFIDFYSLSILTFIFKENLGLTAQVIVEVCYTFFYY